MASVLMAKTNPAFENLKIGKQISPVWQIRIDDNSVFKKYNFSKLSYSIDEIGEYLDAVFTRLTQKQEDPENIQNGIYKKVYFAEVLDAVNGDIYFIYTDVAARAFGLSNRHVMATGGDKIDVLELEVLKNINDIVKAEVDKRITDLNANQLNIITNKVLEVLQINGATPINYSPTMAKISLYKDGEPIDLTLNENIDGSLSGEISLNGNYTIMVKDK